MIPKIIHYCWLSGEPYPEKIQNCIASWKERLPDYKIKLWDMNSFDVNSIDFVREAVSVKKWAFAADYIRLYALYREGGIYLDSDVLVKKFLRPADQSDAVCVQRAKFAREIYAEFAGGEAEDPDGMPDMIQVSEAEYNSMSRAMLLVMYLKDIQNMLGEFEL